MNLALLFVFYFISVLFFYQSGSIVLSWVENDIFKLINCLIFYSLLFYVLRNLIILGKTAFRTNRKALLPGLGILLISAFYVFHVLEGTVNGRVDLLPLVLSNSFERYNFVLDYFNSIDMRSYEKVLIDPFMYLFNFSVTLDHLSIINRIGGIFILLTSFFIGKSFFKSNLLGFLVAVTFGLSRFVQYNLTSIEYGTFSLLFVLLTFNFFLFYLNNRDKQFLNMGIACALIASFFRFELSIILGMPILLYITVFSQKTHLSLKQLSVLTGVLAMRSATIAGYMSPGGDTYVHGKNIGSESILAVIGNISSVLRNNIIEQHDLSLESGSISFLTYVAIATAAFFLLLGICRWILKKHLQPNFAKLFFSALIYFFMFGFVIFVHIEGLRSGEKYSVNFYILEIILSFGVLYEVLSVALKKLSETHKKVICFGVGCLALYAMVSTENGFFVPRPYKQESSFVDQYKILKEIPIEQKCHLIKYSTNTPIVDFFFPMRMKSIELDSIEKLKVVPKTGSCFYLFDSPFYSPKPEVLDTEKVSPLFEECKKDLLYKKEKSYAFIKFSC